MVFPDLYAWYVLMAALDILVTWTVLSIGGAEVNPIARALLELFDVPGLVFLKAASVVLVICVCEILARRSPGRARLLAGGAVVISAYPVAAGLAQLAAF